MECTYLVHRRWWSRWQARNSNFRPWTICREMPWQAAGHRRLTSGPSAQQHEPYRWRQRQDCSLFEQPLDNCNKRAAGRRCSGGQFKSPAPAKQERRRRPGHFLLFWALAGGSPSPPAFITRTSAPRTPGVLPRSDTLSFHCFRTPEVCTYYLVSGNFFAGNVNDLEQIV